MKCRICDNTKLEKFLSLGTTPLANNFLSKEQLKQKEDKFPLEVCFCNNCKLAQLGYVVPAEMMFKNYVYVSSTTKTFQIHFSKMAEELYKEFGLDENSLAVDIGSNDGLLLKGFQKFNVNTIGVEPATNVAKIAKEGGVETINEFFSRSVVDQIIKRKGHADVVTATNVFAHIDNIKDVVANVKILTNDDGIFVIEFPYLVDMLEKMTFDTVYHEHLSYFSIMPLTYLFDSMGMEIFKLQKVESHGGSLRVFVKKKGSKHKIDASVKSIVENEKRLKLGEIQTYSKFAEKVYDVKTKLLNYIKDIKGKGKMIVAYGAPAKGNTLLNFCGIGKEQIGYIVEDNPLKQGLYAPGTHIPVVNSKKLDEEMPDYVLILAWNFAEEILNKTKNYKDKGVKFIIPLPQPRIV